MASVLDEELGNYLKQLNEVEKKSVLLMLKTFLQGRNEGSAGRISIEQYNREIDEALAQVAEGDFITQEEMEKQAAKWKEK